MPRAQNFTQSTIYHIRCIATRAVIYVGSTTSFGQRESGHKHKCNNVNGVHYHYPIYAHIRDNGGWDLFEVIPVAHLQLNNKTELRIAEQFEMDKHTDLRNVNYAVRSKTQYRVDNKDAIDARNKQHYVDNKDMILADRKQHYVDNIDAILAQQKQYRADNKDKIAEYKEQYRAENKDVIAAKAAVTITCQCGCKVTKYHLARHQNTAKHKKLLEQIDQLNYEPIALLPIAYNV